MAVYVCGDTHGTHTIHKLRNFRNGAGASLTKDDYVIVCGDFGGVWNRKEESKEEKKQNEIIKV